MGSSPASVAGSVEVGPSRLAGQLRLCEGRRSLVVIAHGGRSLDERVRSIGELLSVAGVASLGFNLFHDAEAAVGCSAVDVEVLAERVEQALDWVATNLHEASAQRIGLWSNGLGAAAALQVAARNEGRIGAVVSCGGRPDLAHAALARVLAPTLLIIGAADPELVRINRAALSLLSGVRRLEIVPAAAHEFREPGASDTVSHLSAAWFTTHLRASLLA